MKVLLPLLVVVVLAIATVVIVWLLSRTPDTRRMKRELQQLREQTRLDRTFLLHLQSLALANSEFDPFAGIADMQIRAYLENPSTWKALS